MILTSVVITLLYSSCIITFSSGEVSWYGGNTTYNWPDNKSYSAENCDFFGNKLRFISNSCGLCVTLDETTEYIDPSEMTIAFIEENMEQVPYPKKTNLKSINQVSQLLITKRPFFKPFDTGASEPNCILVFGTAARI